MASRMASAKSVLDRLWTARAHCFGLSVAASRTTSRGFLLFELGRVSIATLNDRSVNRSWFLIWAARSSSKSSKNCAASVPSSVRQAAGHGRATVPPDQRVKHAIVFITRVHTVCELSKGSYCKGNRRFYPLMRVHQCEGTKPSVGRVVVVFTSPPPPPPPPSPRQLQDDALKRWQVWWPWRWGKGEGRATAG